MRVANLVVMGSQSPQTWTVAHASAKHEAMGDIQLHLMMFVGVRAEYLMYGYACLVSFVKVNSRP